MRKQLRFSILLIVLWLCYQPVVFGSMIDSAPTQEEIDAAISEATTQQRIIKIGNSGMDIPSAMKQITSLPVIFRVSIQQHFYDIVVMSMSFRVDGASLSVGCRFSVPGSQTNLYFGSSNIAVSGKSGFRGDLPLLQNPSSEFTTFNLPGFNNKLVMGLGKDSKMSFSCGSFQNFSLSGYVIASDLVTPEDSKGSPQSDDNLVRFTFEKQQTSDWKDIFINAKVSSGFHATNYADLGFHFGDQDLATIDLSNLRNPENLPACAKVSAENWQGVAFPSFKFRLPAFFKLRSGNSLSMTAGKNLFMDASGLLGDAVAEKVYTLKEGYTDEINKYDMSLNKLTATFSCNGQVSVSMLGEIGIPWCGTATKSDAPLLRYSFRYANDRYEIFVKDSDQGTFSSNKYALSTGSQLIFNVKNSALLINAILPEKPQLATNVYQQSICKDFPVTLTASACSGRQMIWSNGDTGGSITVKPQVTTTYTVKCQDNYCVTAVSDSMKITVYESLPKPSLLSDRDAFCEYENTSLHADGCVGQMEWKMPGSGNFTQASDNRSQLASFQVDQSTNYSYSVRCNLNGCLSPETTKTIAVHAQPNMPRLTSDAANNTIDRNGTVNLSGNCAAGERLIWQNLPQSSVVLTSSSTYHALCRNDAIGCQGELASIAINVLYFPPAAPSNLTFTEVGSNRLKLNWQDNSNNEDGFIILRSTSSSYSNAQQVGTVAANVTSFQDLNLNEGIVYYYQVISHNRYDRGYSDWSGRQTIVTPGVPELWATSTNIPKGSDPQVKGRCATGNLEWIAPSGYNGNGMPQWQEVTYRARCVDEGIPGAEARLTVTVYTPKPNLPRLVSSSSQIERGSSVNVTGSCDLGTLIWISPLSFAGGEKTLNDNTTYSAKCVNDGVESDVFSLNVTVFDVPQAPRPNLRADKNPVKPGENTVVYADGCDGTVVWSNGATGNSIWTGAGEYSAICRKNGHRDSERVYITVSVDNTPTEQPQAPRPNLRADKSPVKPGENTVVYADGCDGTVVWSNGATGNSIWTGAGEYSAICRKDGHRDSERAYITVEVDNTTPEQPQAPRPNLRADKSPVKPGENTVVYADGCDGIVIWSNGATGNSIWTGAGEYSAICRKDGHRDSERAYITVEVDNTTPEQPQAPRPNLRADKSPVKPGENTVVSADGCDGTVVWSNGSTGNSIWTGAGEYSAICRKDGHRDSERAYITVEVDNTTPEQPQAPRPNLRADKNPVKPGENTVVYADGCDGTVIWSNGATGNSIWTGAGEYSAICRKDGHRDSERAYITVSVDNTPTEQPQAPKPNLWAEKNPVEIGEQTKIHADGCDGTIIWSNGSTGNYLPAGAGDYSAICRKDGYRDSEQSSIRIDQKSNPCPTPLTPVLSGPDEVEKGRNFSLHLTGCNGATYTTNTNPGQEFKIMEGINLFFYGSLETTTQFQVECRKDGCASASTSKTVRVKPSCVTPAMPSISGPKDVFKGDSIQLVAYGCDPGSTFNWSGPGIPQARIGTGSSAYNATIYRDAEFSVSCTVEGGCTSPLASHLVQVIDIPQPVDRNPNWKSQGTSCNGTGILYKDTNPNSPTYNQTKCEGGINCVTYKITVFYSDNEYSDNPNTCNSCTVYTSCDGTKRVGSFSGMTPGSTYTIDAKENSIDCRGCYASPVSK